ncbi:sugar phosphate isomerase/epimerase [Fundidesulfovibrio butyratiphilus]
MFFVNLTLRHAYRDPAVLTRFLARKVNPELGLDPVLMDAVDMDWHKTMAERLEREGLTCSLHLPFFDLQPGSADSLLLEATRERLRRAMQVAKIYRPRHLVAHARYDHLLYMLTYPLWKERSLETWKRTLDVWPDHPPLYLENTAEPDPATVTELVETLAVDHGMAVGLCLDFGHWYSFAKGKEENNLDAWLDAAQSCLSHVHLHDNDGSFDQHLGLGAGTIPWEDVFEGLEKRNLTPTVTFEPHGEEAFVRSMAFVLDRADWFDPLGVTWEAHAKR